MRGPLLNCVYSMQAKVSSLRPTHYEAMRLVDYPQPGQGGDFDDEAPVTLPEKKGEDKSKGGKHTFELLTYICVHL